MKAAAAPLPVDRAALEDWQTTLANRPCWIASSTHPGEDAIMLDAHKAVRQMDPSTLLILVPRHPLRGTEIADLAHAQGLSVSRRAGGEPVTGDTEVLVADTIGELGLWYRLCPIVCLAGSFGEAGGHNPWEAIQLGAALLHGPNVPNAAGDYRDLQALGAAVEVSDATSLARAVVERLSNPEILTAQQDAARAALTGADDLVQRVAHDIRDALTADAHSQ